VFDGHGGREVAAYSKLNFEQLLKKSSLYPANPGEALRTSFLGIDEKLNAGGLEEIAEMKRKNPPAKSPLMKILAESMGKGKGMTPGMITDEGEEGL
jgi:hypothetical protein